MLARTSQRMDAGSRRTMAGAALLVVLAPALGGCQKQLFPESAPRTQFEQYDALRSGGTPKEEPDVFGKPQPALRARLTPPTQTQ